MAKIIKNDGWANVLTGLNIMNRDKKMMTKANYRRFSQVEVEEIYAISKLARKIVDLPVVDAFRKKPIFKKGEADESFSEDVHDMLHNYDFWKKFVKAARWGRLYGAGFLMFGIRDGRLPHEPVDFNNIRSVDWIQPLHRHELGYLQIERDVSQEFYREPVVYTLNEAGASQDDPVGFSVHRSRLVRLDGDELPDELYKLNGYFHDSVIPALLDALRNYSASHDSAASLLEDFAQGVFKIQNLGQLIAAGKDDQVLKRLQLIDATRSNVRGIVIDAEEEFRREVTALTGLRDLLKQMGDRLVGESEIPHTILLGEGSTGNLSGSGDSETRQYYDMVKALQMGGFKPAIMQSLNILMSAKTFGGVPTGLDIDFPPLEEMSEKDQAEIHFKQAQADHLYIQDQVISPDEVALSRFGGKDYSLDTQINEEARGEIDDVEPPSSLPDPEPTPTPPTPPIIEDEVDHVHELDGRVSGPAIKAEGGHYHQILIDGEMMSTGISADTAHHTHEVDFFGKVSPAMEMKSDEALSEEERTPPAGAKNNAKKVQGWIEEHGDEVKGMTSVGRRRMGQLASGGALSVSVIKRMAQFARHEKNSKIDPKFKGEPWKDNGYVAWLGWGGDAGINWAKRVVEKLNKAKK